MSAFQNLKQGRKGSPATMPASNGKSSDAKVAPASASPKEKQVAAELGSLLRHMHAAPETFVPVHDDELDKASAPIEQRKSAARGRGLHMKDCIDQGTTLLASCPIVAVLDSSHILTCCSTCYSSQGESGADNQLMRCGRCRLVRYCSADCQRADWESHKPECRALIAYSASKASSKKPDEVLVPQTEIRALGRLLWTRKREGPEFWRKIEMLQSNRTKLTATQQEKFWKLSIALASYVGQDTLEVGCPSAIAVTDFLSRYYVNYTPLLSRYYEEIGQSLSPLAARINHSCRANSVIVFPAPAKPKSEASRRCMRVVALNEIHSTEELLVSYVDPTLPRRLRQKQLKERWHFTCSCVECSRPASPVDPREALTCSIGPLLDESACKALIPMPNLDERNASGTVSIKCPECGAVNKYEPSKLKTCMVESESALIEARELSKDSPTAAVNLLSACLLDLVKLGWASTAWPFTAIMSELYRIDIQLQPLTTGLATGGRLISAQQRLFPFGHPATARTAYTQATLDWVARTEEDETGDRHFASRSSAWSLHLAVIDAMRESELAFGTRTPTPVISEELLDILLRTQTELGILPTRKKIKGKGKAVEVKETEA